MNARMLARVAAVGVVGLAFAGVGVAPQLSARLTGDEIRLRVAPVDPIDPFRGAYVALSYPDLRQQAVPMCRASMGEPMGFERGHTLDTV